MYNIKLFYRTFNILYIAHGKNDFAEISKNLSLKIILLDYQNNYMQTGFLMFVKLFAALFELLHNYYFQTVSR